MTGKTHLWVGNPEFFFLEIPKKTVMMGAPMYQENHMGEWGIDFCRFVGLAVGGGGFHCTQLYIYICLYISVFALPLSVIGFSCIVILYLESMVIPIRR